MTAIGALCAVITVVAAITLLRRASKVEQRLARLAPRPRTRGRWRPVSDRDLTHSGTGRTQLDVASAKLLGALAGASIAAAAGQIIGLAVPAALAGGYVGFLMPSLLIERRAAARRRLAERPIAVLFERLDALAGSGRPVETALVAVAGSATGSAILDAALRGAADAYALGAPFFRSLASHAAAQGLDELATFAVALERSRDLGQGSLAALRDARDSSRTRRRVRSLEAAAKVEGKLMLTLVLCYLPALFLLVVIPLFLTLLDGLFG